jgi:hypothetical protein
MKILDKAKAYAAFIGAIVTAVLGTQAPGSTLFTVLTIVSVVATAIATYQVPNQPSA